MRPFSAKPKSKSSTTSLARIQVSASVASGYGFSINNVVLTIAAICTELLLNLRQIRSPDKANNIFLAQLTQGLDHLRRSGLYAVVSQSYNR